MLQDRLFLAENSARVTIAQVFGGLLLFASILIALRNVKIAQENARTAQKTLQVTEDGKLTERFSKAVELLGSDKLDTRLGGVYALERIARDSRNDHWTVIEILTAFVREKSLRDWRDRKKKADEAKAEVGQDSSSSVQVTALRHKVEPDIQAALSVIGRRKWIESETQDQRLDLPGARLDGAEIFGGNFDRTIFDGASLERTKIIGSTLIKAELSKVRLDNAEFCETNLSDAVMDDAICLGTDFSKTIGLSLDQIKKNRWYRRVKIPADLDAQRKAELQKILEAARAKQEEEKLAKQKGYRSLPTFLEAALRKSSPINYSSFLPIRDPIGKSLEGLKEKSREEEPPTI